jgi:hypothetical protein
MSFEAISSPACSWSMEAFGSFWADPDLAQAPGVRAIITHDIVGHWPRPIGMVRGDATYYKVIESVLIAEPDSLLRSAGMHRRAEFTFIRWIATVTDKDETVQFNG